MKERPWAAVNLSWDTYVRLRKIRKSGESLNDTVRGLMDTPVPDPTRKQRRHAYFDEDWIKKQ